MGWLKKTSFYGSIDKIFDVSLSKLQSGKEAQMGKSLNCKESGKGISQRKGVCIRHDHLITKVKGRKP